MTRATREHVPLVHGMLDDAARRLAERDIDQWPHPYPEHVVHRSVDRQDTYIAWQGDQPVGSMAINWDDPTVWGDQPPDAGYVHRLVIANGQHGKGLGPRLLDWAAAHMAARGRRWIRLNCVAGNPQLRAFYERERFAHIRDVELSRSSGVGVWRASLYQRPATIGPSALIAGEN